MSLLCLSSLLLSFSLLSATLPSTSLRVFSRVCEILLRGYSLSLPLLFIACHILVSNYPAAVAGTAVAGTSVAATSVAVGATAAAVCLIRCRQLGGFCCSCLFNMCLRQTPLASSGCLCHSCHTCHTCWHRITHRIDKPWLPAAAVAFSPASAPAAAPTPTSLHLAAHFGFPFCTFPFFN